MKNALRSGIVVFGLALSVAGLPAQAAEKIFDVAHRQEMSWIDLSSELAKSEIVVMGEEHYNPAVQQAEAEIIHSTIQLIDNPRDFTVGWEFLNFSDRARNDSLFGQVKTGESDSAHFIEVTQEGLAQAKSYIPVIDTIADGSGALVSLNLSHAEKAPMVQGGLHALDPALVPPGYAPGSANYFERFKAAMAGHAPADQLANYFDAQCVTDDVMAYHLLQGHTPSMRFLIAGNFHTEFGEGVVARIRARGPAFKTATVRIYDASSFTNPAQQMEALMHDAHYGDVADYAVFMNLR